MCIHQETGAGSAGQKAPRLCRTGVDAVAFQALEDPRVHDAVEGLAKLNIPTLTIMSGLEHPAPIGFIGINNRAAGRTAGYLMGRLTRQAGSVLVVTGGELYRVHEDREIGFRACLRQDFSHIGEAIVVNGHDDAEGNHQGIQQAFSQRDDIVGIYNVGGGHQGVVSAMRDLGVANEVVFIGHNLTSRTKSYLLDGAMDIVIHLNVRIVAEQTVEALISHLENRPFKPNPISDRRDHPRKHHRRDLRMTCRQSGIKITVAKAKYDNLC